MNLYLNGKKGIVLVVDMLMKKWLERATPVVLITFIVKPMMKANVKQGEEKMKSNLLKKELELISTEDLNLRYCYILDRAEKSEAKDIPVTDAQHVLWIEDILRKRFQLIRYLGRDPYLPDQIEIEHPSNYMVSLLKSRSKPTPKATEIIHPCSAAVTKKAEIKTEGTLRFKITITSSIGSVVKTSNVKVDSRSEADTIAVDLIKELGLKKAKYKIS